MWCFRKTIVSELSLRFATCYFVIIKTWVSSGCRISAIGWVISRWFLFWARQQRGMHVPSALKVSDSGGFHTAECLLVLFWYRVKWRYGGIKKMDNMTETNDRERHWKDDGWHPVEAMSVLVGGVLVTYHFRLRPRETQAPWGSSSFSNPVMPNLEMNQASFYESGPIVHAHTSDVKRSHMSALNVRSGVTLRSPALPFNIPL